MSSRTRPPWLKKLERIIGRLLRSGSLTPEAASLLCDEVLPSIQRRSPQPVVSAAADVWRADRRPSWELERFIGECFRSGDLGPEDALDLFDELLHRARPGSIYALNQLLTTVARAPVSSTVREGPALAVSLFNRMVKKTGLRADAVIFTPLLRTLCAEKRTSDAVNIVVRRMPELGCTPDVFSYTTLLKGLCDEKKCEEAVELIHMMAEDGNCPPNAVSYTTVKAMDKAEEVRRQMFDKHIMPDCATYNSLIHGYLSLGQWKEAVRILKEMSGDGQRPDVVTYNMLIDCLCKSGLCTEAREIFNSMIQSGEKPNVSTYRSLLHGYATEGNLVEMNNVKDLMQLGLMPDIVTYNTVIDGLCKIGRLDDAMSQFSQMIHDGLSADIITFRILIHGFSMYGKWEKAEELFYEMMDRGIPPDVNVFNAMIDKLFKEGKVTEARKLFDLMPRAGVKPNVVSYNAMIHGYFLAGEVDEVMKLLDDMLLIGLKPTAVTFSTLLDGMVSMGLKPDVVTCKTLIDSCCEDGRIEDVLTVFREMLSKADKSDTITENIISGDERVVHIYSSETGEWSNRSSEWKQFAKEGERDNRYRVTVKSRLGSCFLNGMLHFLVQRSRPNIHDVLIVAVDGEGSICRVIHWKLDMFTKAVFIGQSQGRLHCISDYFIDKDKDWRDRMIMHVHVLQDYDAEKWIKKFGIWGGELSGREECRIKDYEVVAIHPDGNFVYFVDHRKGELIQHHMSRQYEKVLRLCTLGHNYRAVTPYVPCFSRSSALETDEAPENPV
ncbi:unnamed protein product [Miscanthus lutarioriparius]|uniref:PROP1-like PPR domain-containing protein n=1 Tax=Miscanthus lutarioriparius TaxID=422564 RepID=A0A811N4M5_9POAL|nr:unnamed protein product [Miscanthus lutarioriparius]